MSLAGWSVNKSAAMGEETGREDVFLLDKTLCQSSGNVIPQPNMFSHVHNLATSSSVMTVVKPRCGMKGDETSKTHERIKDWVLNSTVNVGNAVGIGQET